MKYVWWSLVFFVLALVCFLFAFVPPAVLASVTLGQILFFFFVACFAGCLIMGAASRK